VPARQVIRNVLAAEGVAGFYRGFLPNAAKNLPNKGACFDQNMSSITAFYPTPSNLPNNECIVRLFDSLWHIIVARVFVMQEDAASC
jgi:Mitochondrial carrier protein